MAQLALRLPVFLASPSDVQKERQYAEKVILSLSREVSKQRLLLEPLRWERDAVPSLERPNEVTLRLLRVSELTVFIFWSTLGSPSRAEGTETGTLEELRVAWSQVKRGSSDDLFVYHRSSPPLSGDPAKSRQVQEFIADLKGSREVYLFSYETPEEFRRLLTQHLRQWLVRWYHVPEICEYALENSTPAATPSRLLTDNRLIEVERRFDFQSEKELAYELGRCAVSLYQRFGMEAVEHPIRVNHIKRGRRRLDGLCSIGPAEPQRMHDLLASLQGELSFGPAPLRRDPGGDMFFGGKEWFHFFCSLGLLEAIRNDCFEAVYRHPYGNPVHQYLAALGGRPENRSILVPHLMSWLSRTNGAAGSTPIVRNFAAYVLGMIEAHEALDVLAEALQDKGQDVALYSICALGKMRSRRHLPKLVELWLESSDDQKRLTLSQAICRSIGIAEYEL